MSLLDNSDFAVMATKENLEEKKRAVLEEVLRDEEFITGEVRKSLRCGWSRWLIGCLQEIEIGGLKVELGSEVEGELIKSPVGQ